jgi:hypothetical protein
MKSKRSSETAFGKKKGENHANRGFKKRNKSTVADDTCHTSSAIRSGRTTRDSPRDYFLFLTNIYIYIYVWVKERKQKRKEYVAFSGDLV